MCLDAGLIVNLVIISVLIDNVALAAKNNSL